MKHKPLISIIIPVYNTERYLRQCLDSICGQTYRQLEVICVDDGSTDNSLAILQEYEARDRRFKVITQQNARVAAARNAALELATGEWVTGVDPDDYLELNAYEEAVKGISAEVDLVCFGARVVQEGAFSQTYCEGVEGYLGVPFKGVRELTDDTLARLNYNIWNKLYRRSVIEDNHIRFDERFWCASDLSFNIEFCTLARAAFYIRKKLYVYLLRSDSITYISNSDTPRCETHLLCLERMAAHANAHPGMVERLPRFFSHHIRHFHDILMEYGVRNGQQERWADAFAEVAQRSGLARYSALRPALEDCANPRRWERLALRLAEEATHSPTPPQEGELLHLAWAAGDDAQLQRLLVSLAGLRATAGQQPCCAHILCPTLSSFWRRQLSACEGAGLRLCLHELEPRLLALLPLADKTGLLRALTPLLLPGIKRVLLLGNDCLLAASPQTLVNQEMGESVVAAPALADAGLAQARQDVYTLSQYRDASAALLNLERLRAGGMERRWVAALFLHTTAQAAPTPVDAFNMAFHLHMAVLEPGDTLLRETDVEQHPLWQEYQEASPWKGLPLLPLAEEKPAPLPTQQDWALAVLAADAAAIRRRYRFHKLMASLSWGASRRRHRAQAAQARRLIQQLRAARHRAEALYQPE